jgi:hypothetical protein
MIAAALLALFVGAGLIVIGFGRLLVARSAGWRLPVSLLASGAVLVVLSLLLMQGSRGGGQWQIATAAVLALGGFLICGVGLWQALWGVASARNARQGVTLILIGLAMIVVAVLVVAGVSVHGGSSAALDVAPAVRSIASRRIGPLPFGAFAAVAFIVALGLGLRHRLSIGQLLGALAVVMAMLIVLYWIAPSLW